jgi:preprotein translocase subunit SecF
MEFDLNVLAAVLTVVGYSLNDTIVVFDRVRENARRIRNDTMRNIIDISMTETLSRTLITSGTTLITVIALFWKGGPMIHGFATALLIGICFRLFILELWKSKNIYGRCWKYTSRIYYSYHHNLLCKYASF